LVRWGTDIHDRWMLPHYVWSDFRDVTDELKRSGFPVQLEWFARIFEFRFPACGTLELDNIFLEVRHALEPCMSWEKKPARAARCVRDSSLEPVQVKIRG